MSKEINLPPFYVGQRVVTLKDGKHLKVKKGTIVIVLDIKKLTCGCWVVYVGGGSTSVMTRCSVHESISWQNHGKHFSNANLFAPIEENFQSITLEKVLEIETPLITSN